MTLPCAVGPGRPMTLRIACPQLRTRDRRGPPRVVRPPARAKEGSAMRLAAAFVSVALASGIQISAVGSHTVTAAVGVPTPNAGAPSGTLFPLADEGYQEAEFFVAGTASSYHNAAGPPF